MSIAAIWSIRVLLALLGLFSIAIESYFVPQYGQSILSTSPEAAPLFVPALIWSILLIGCGQAILVIVWRLVSLAGQDRVFSSAALPWVRAMIAIPVGALTLLITAFIVANVLEYTPPLFMYGLIGLSLFCIAFTLVMKTMLGLLRRAMQLHDEMNEVI